MSSLVYVLRALVFACTLVYLLLLQHLGPIAERHAGY
jgi:hypothetical protein